MRGVRGEGVVGEVGGEGEGGEEGLEVGEDKTATSVVSSKK